MKIIGLACILSGILTSFSFSEEKAPNLVVILADDMGFSDLGCFGSEIETPNLDRLAANGLRFSQFYNAAKCHVSRTSLMSGRWCQEAGGEGMHNAVTIPEVLKPAGYFTAMTGKWDLDKQPTDFGFERYFGHLSGFTNYYAGDKSFRLNGQPFTVPKTNFYTTVADVDYAIRFLDEARTAKKPYFLYLAFNAPHFPLQPLEIDYKKYLGKYDVGWDVIRDTRIAKQKANHILPANTEIPPRPDHIPAWNHLSPEWQKWEAQRMAAYAGMVDRLDQEVGRLLANITEVGELENTCILFLSDNGACPFDREIPEPDREPFHADSNWSCSTGWAWTSNTPFRFYKQNQYEGGISSPAIVHWPAGLKTAPGAVVSTPADLVDVLPTFAELGRATIPTKFPGREPSPLAGISLVPIFNGHEQLNRPPLHLWYTKDRGLRDGEWKIVSFQNQPWELYHMTTDRTEMHDVAAQNPEILQRLIKEWHDISANVLKVPAGQNKSVDTEVSSKTNSQWTDYTVPLIGDSQKNDSGKSKKKKDRKDSGNNEN